MGCLTSASKNLAIVPGLSFPISHFSEKLIAGLQGAPDGPAITSYSYWRHTGCPAGKAEPTEDERIECGWFTVKEIEGRIQKGTVVDAKTMIGLFTWKRFYRKG